MDIPAGIRQTLDSLEAAGYEACVVGGCVRDHLLGVVPHDWDIATSATPPQVAEALAGARLIPTGIAHGTWTLLLPDLPVEITSYRADGPYLDNRHPQEVRYAPSLQEDLARRDFTLNAIAYHPQRGFSDPFGGRDDISAQLLRAVGQPQLRLSEDALRIMRALRFAATIGFAIEDQLAQALHEQRQLLANIAVERLSAELIRMLPGANILPVLLEYPDVLAVFIPEIAPTIGFDQQTKYHQYDVWEHSAHAVALAAPDPLVRLTLLLHDLGKPECFFTDADGVGHFYGHDLAGERIARKRLKALHFDSKTIQTVSTLIAEHQARFKL
ncbi:MAG: CCA tRNA nucleotidyltransferase, partial [Coriobacteriales bacterium]|nr:CCA tRNA nucleotidyltransferase [Coriobacteriales bacterium]